MSHTPLLALTADRPPELQDRGAPQTINQTNLYGAAAKWFHDTGVPNTESIADATHLGRQAMAVALESPAGPVHLNIPLREPLVTGEFGPEGRPAARVAPHPLVTVPRATAAESEIRRIAALISGRPTLIVAGASTSPGLATAIADLAQALRAVVIADPQSPFRFAGTGDPALVAAADLLLASGDPPAPHAVLQVGAVHTSKPVNRWLQSLGTPFVHIHDGQWGDPLGVATAVVVADPAATLGDLAKVVEPAPEGFFAVWRRWDDAVRTVLATAPARLTEPAVADTLLTHVPAGAFVFAGSSMPIRLIDSHATARPSPARVVANRGANGIDGSIATALGLAAAGLGPTYALIGDLAALADIGSLVTARRLEVPVTIVVINNDGGGIFEYLPQADPAMVDAATYRDLIVAPHGQSIAPIAAACGIDTETVDSLEALVAIAAGAPRGPRLVEVHTQRSAGPAARDHLIRRIAAATADLPTTF